MSRTRSITFFASTFRFLSRTRRAHARPLRRDPSRILARLTPSASFTVRLGAGRTQGFAEATARRCQITRHPMPPERLRSARVRAPRLHQRYPPSRETTRPMNAPSAPPTTSGFGSGCQYRRAGCGSAGTYGACAHVPTNWIRLATNGRGGVYTGFMYAPAAGCAGWRTDVRRSNIRG